MGSCWLVFVSVFSISEYRKKIKRKEKIFDFYIYVYIYIHNSPKRKRKNLFPKKKSPKSRPIPSPPPHQSLFVLFSFFNSFFWAALAGNSLLLVATSYTSTATTALRYSPKPVDWRRVWSSCALSPPISVRVHVYKNQSQHTTLDLYHCH
jgi:hypothetical protein